MQRRDFLHSLPLLAGAGMLSCKPEETAQVPSVPELPTYPAHVLNIHGFINDPVTIRSIEVLETVKERFLVVTAHEGQQGITLLNFRMEFMMPMMQGLLAPFFIGRDARDIEQVMDEVLHNRAVYKYSGIPLFNGLGHIEIAIMDLLGKVAGVPCGHFFGQPIRTELPMYISSLTRETSPEEEVANLQQKLAETGAKAIKVKVGGRMSRNQDAAPGRTETLIPLLRKVLGDQVTIYADANSSFDAREGIKVARLLEDHGVALFEEPCYWEDYQANKQVADTLTTMKLAGGEQDTSYLRFRDIITNRVYHVVQPDLYYNGGMLRCQYVAQLAASHGLTIAPHSPKADPLAAPFLQFASSCPNLEGFQEYPYAHKAFPDWYAPHFPIQNGKVQIPAGPGLGLTYDEAIWKKATLLAR
jgi:L-alanine-DL-glutamate epimerase-like enolase superfamily enzyme